VHRETANSDMKRGEDTTTKPSALTFQNSAGVWEQEPKLCEQVDGSSLGPDLLSNAAAAVNTQRSARFV